ncbi:MAG: DUF1365 domain-containing protein [Coriobacteriia bacterium]|nr:DUF1365 domain-containing protein [Coriobacteriia bacterium]
MNSRLYTGIVAHSRTRPKENAFAYRAYFVYVDLDELDALDASLSKFSHNGRALVRFRDADHGPRDGSPLRPWIDALLAGRGIDLTGGSVRILAFPRVLGFGFYPVSFWYCFAADGTPRAVLAEVQNTFGGHHNYLLHNDGDVFDWDSRPTVDKVFSVSPFIAMDARYEFAISKPDNELSVTISDFVAGPLLLTASLQLNAEPLTDEALSRVVRKYGPMSLRAWLLIHWQALHIVGKGIAYIPPRPDPEEETT